MVIWSEFRMVQYGGDDHQKDAPHCIFRIAVFYRMIRQITSFHVPIYFDTLK